MKKINLVAFLIGFMAMVSVAQIPNRCSYVTPRQTDNWFFYSNGGIQFTDAGVVSNNLPDGQNNLPLGNGTAALSDENGQLLIYTTGQRVYNRDHMNITGRDNLAGNLGSTQSALIIQNPSVSQMMYVFTTDQVTQEGTKGLNYSRVDMTAMSGNGAVMEYDVPLLSNGAPLLAGVKKSNGIDYWVLAHSLDDNKFHAFTVDASGVSSSSIESSVGPVISSDYNISDFGGYMKFSPKGDKLALTSQGQRNLQLFSFDNSTGRVSNPVNIPVTFPSDLHIPYCVEFSPDGTKLYVTVIHRSNMNGIQNTLYQYDLLNGNIETKLNDAPMGDDVIAVQLGRDGKIYVLRRFEYVFGAIENPNRSGTDCNYDENAISLSGAKAYNGLPNFVASFLDIPPVDYDTKCEDESTQFFMLNTSNVDNVDWNFGDTASASNIITAGPTDPVHDFSGPGDYTVTFTENFNGKSWTHTFPVTINPKPAQSFPPDKDSAFIVNGSALTVYAVPDMYSYYWDTDGSTNISYTIEKEGMYTLLVEDMKCCQRYDTLYVTGLQIKVPSAFSPDGNGLNDYFSALGPSEGVIDFSFTIYNKWGQMVWETTNFEDKWDGKIGSSPAAAGIYTWYINLNVPGNEMRNGKVKLTGTVMLFR